MNKAFKFRLYPNAEQRVLLAKTFGCCRFIFNRMLADKKTYFELTGKVLYCYPSQYKNEYPWLREVDSLALVGADNGLKSAYENFFRDKSIGFPKFKSRHKGHNSYTTNLINGNIELSDGFLKLPKLGKVKIKQHRQIPDDYILKSVTVSLVPSGKYYASILYEHESDIKQVIPATILGLDFSMSELYMDSNGEKPGFPHPYRKAQKRLAREQRKLSKQKKGGANYRKQKLKIAKLHEHIANQRKDFLHKRSRQIANACDAVSIEDLNMKGMSQALNFGKSVSDNGWGAFTRMLDYKLTEQGKQLVKIDKWYPSSKMCFSCGMIRADLPLAEREYRCECGYTCDRDLNAALNIREEGKRLLCLKKPTVGHTGLAC